MLQIYSILKKYVIILCIIFLSLVPIFKFRDIIFSPINMETYGKKYGQSQYVLGNDAIEKIDDSELYVYAGFAYIKGQDPTTINFEHPPLAKYIYGLSFLLFKNSYTLNIILYPLLLIVFYFFSSTVLKSQKAKIIALFFFGSLPLLNEMVRYILLDIPFLIGLTSLLALLGYKTQHTLLKYCLVGLILGVIASIKYPIPFIFIPSLFIVIHSLINKEFKYIFFLFPIALSVYILQYSIYFMYHPNIFEFLRFEKYRYDWWTAYRTAPKFLILSNLFFGHYKAWWEANLIQYSKEWTISIPIFFVGHILSFIKIKKNIWFWQLFIYASLLLFVYGYGSAAELRYLLQIIPIWIVIFIKYFEEHSNNRVH